MPRNITDLDKERSLSKTLSSNERKTTDVNILLNRVRLDKKKNFRKNILFSLLLVSLLISISIFFII